MDKDVYAYLFCSLYPGRTLVFVNAIACARRLGALLTLLRVPATPLHAQMQQRQRLKSLDRFTANDKAVMVATDVAARGLDIPKVEHVVHYDAARSPDVFIHRSGRTARANSPGLALSIVAPKDASAHQETCRILGLGPGGLGGMEAFPLEAKMVDRARERVGLAVTVLKHQEHQSCAAASNDFFRGMSHDADLEMDSDLLDTSQGEPPEHGGKSGKGGRHAARLAAEARSALEASLSHPLHMDRRKIIPVAEAVLDMHRASQRTAMGDLTRKRGGKTHGDQ
ncbi:unnamed protein product [Discosporangium mesarthrocarpum]